MVLAANRVAVVQQKPVLGLHKKQGFFKVGSLLFQGKRHLFPCSAFNKQGIDRLAVNLQTHRHTGVFSRYRKRSRKNGGFSLGFIGHRVKRYIPFSVRSTYIHKGEPFSLGFLLPCPVGIETHLRMHDSSGNLPHETKSLCFIASSLPCLQVLEKSLHIAPLIRAAQGYIGLVRCYDQADFNALIRPLCQLPDLHFRPIKACLPLVVCHLHTGRGVQNQNIIGAVLA